MMVLLDLSIKMLGWFAAFIIFMGTFLIMLTGVIIAADVGLVIYEDLKERLSKIREEKR